MNEKISVILTLKMKRVPTVEELNRSFSKFFNVKTNFKEKPLPSAEEVKKAFYTFVNSDFPEFLKKYAIDNDLIVFYKYAEQYIEEFNKLFNSKFTIEVKGNIIIVKYVLDNKNKIGKTLRLQYDIIDPSYDLIPFADFVDTRLIASVIATAIRKYISPEIFVYNNFLVKIKEADLPDDNDVKELVKQIPKEGGFVIIDTAPLHHKKKELRALQSVPFYRIDMRGNHVTLYVFGFCLSYIWYRDPVGKKVNEIKEKLRTVMREKGYIKFD